ncbi:hypothetical protein HDV04_002370 [Boothiomyces sp. JEL0838]|nr:hypothetical protein HDV04_002370 [Boothiomyces sp. JEL0838]
MSVVEFLKLKVYQYELTTGLYMLEPLEKIILNSIFLLFAFMGFYSFVSYFPSSITSFGRLYSYYFLE